MYRKLSETEIALIRLNIWPCCGGNEVEAGPRGGIMRNMRCPRCGTVINIPALPVDTQGMLQMGEMIHQPQGYDPENIAKQHDLDAAQIERVNTITSPAPHEARQNMAKLLHNRRARTTNIIGGTTLAGAILTQVLWTGSQPAGNHVTAAIMTVGILVLAARAIYFWGKA